MLRELKYSFPCDFNFLYVTWENDLIGVTVVEKQKNFAFPESPVFQIRSVNFFAKETNRYGKWKSTVIEDKPSGLLSRSSRSFILPCLLILFMP